MTQPNFFLVGAPRCGTTAMIQYLSLHPEITVASYKEPHFFGSDLRGERFNMYRGNQARYERLFSHAKDEKRIGEGSVAYLFSERAAQEIHAYNPDALILIMLRHPVEALYSMYKQATFTGSIDFPDFETMLETHHQLPADAVTETNQKLLSLDGVSYGKQVTRYYEQFPREAIHVVLYDDFSADTARTYAKTLTFLGVDPDFKPADFAVINASQTHRNPLIERMLKNKYLQRIGMAIPDIALPIYRLFKQMNATQIDKSQQTDVPLSVYRQVIEQLQPDITALSQLIDRDLSHWLTVPEQA